ncbi:MAG: hypothetical protein ACRD4D_08940 [Candidatus Acidiferrales bacterium]
MEFPIPYPGFEGRGLAIRLPGLFSNPRMVLDGAEVKGEKWRYQLRDNKGVMVEAKLKSNFFDAVPKVEIGGQVLELAPPLPWYAYAWSAFPLLLIFVGGAVGGGCGALAAFANARVFRSEQGTAAKFAITAMISAAAVVVYLVVGGILYVLIQGTGS